MSASDRLAALAFGVGFVLCAANAWLAAQGVPSELWRLGLGGALMVAALARWAYGFNRPPPTS